MVGKATAVLVEMVMLPFESVEVVSTRTATGVVGKVVAGGGEGVMMMLLDAGAGEDWVLLTGASVGAGPPSDSVDVEVFVIYNAVCNAIAGLFAGSCSSKT